MNDDILVFLNGIMLLDDDWQIVNNDLLLSTFVGKDDEIKVKCGEAWVKWRADGLTNRWPLGMEVEQLKFRSFMDEVYRRREEPLINNLIDQLRMAIGLLD